MVCKEDVLSWFKDLECYKRIDLMYELLNMCMPFEIRFVGSCIEEIGKHSYQELRGLTIIANDVEKLSKDNTLANSLLDENTRSRVLLYISLLSARNCLSANWLFKKLFRTAVFEDFIVNGNCKEEGLQSELLLLLTMSLYHPAFTFDQKTFFSTLLIHLIQQKEGKKSIAIKPNTFYYPPGFGYPPPPIIPNSEIPVIPIKTASPLGTGEANQHPPPPGLPLHAAVNPNIEYMPAVWQRPAFTATMCAAPEGLAFPTRSISPLVSQPTSLPSSRGSSPHRAYTIRSVTGLPPPPPPPSAQHNLDMQSNPAAVTMDPLSSPSIPKYMPLLKSNEDELSHLQEEKFRDVQWLNQFDLKRPNGMQMFYGMDQLRAALKLEGENSLHCSTSSSNSSLNQSPPQTPTATLIAPHGPGRGGANGPSGDTKSRMNGMPPPFMAGMPPPPAAGAPPPMCESTPPPPFSNCTVPYSNYPSHVTLTALPNRCIFQYSSALRPSFNTPFTYHPDTGFTSPYLHMPIYSSVHQQAHQHQRTPPTCCNCGATGHTGVDCSAQTIEDITQKAYSLEYAPLSESDK